MGAARPPWSRAESWLLQAPLRAGCCAQGVHGMHICMSVPSFIGYTGMLPCPVPARDGRSCWGQSCGTHLVVVLLGGFCSPCRARGPGQGHPCLPHASSEQLWARLCPTFTEGVRDQLWFAQVDLRLMAALCTPPLAGGVPAMLLPPGEHPDGPPQLQAPAPAAGSSTQCCHMLLPWKLSHCHMLTSSHPGHLCSPSGTRFGADNASGQVTHSPAAGGNVPRTAAAAGAGLWAQVDQPSAEGSC